MNPRSHSRSAGATVVLLALLLTAASSFGQTVGSFAHAKIQNYLQASSSAPILDSTQPFQFGSFVARGTATIASATLTFPGTASPRSYTSVGTGSVFTILDTFTTAAQLDAAYGTGTYNLTVNTDAGAFSRSMSLLFSFFGFPTVPRLTVPAADWENGVLVIDSTIDYTFTWAAFSGAQVNDLIQLVIYNSPVSPAPFPGTQTSYVVPAGSLQPGTEYAADLAFVRVINLTAADADFGQGIGARVSNTGFTIRTLAPALALVSALSRKEHGSGAGIHDIELPLSGTPGVECRTGGAGGDHLLVFTFSNPVVSGTATVTGGTGNIASTPVLNGNTMAVALTGVANAQTVTVTLSGVTDSFSQVLPDNAVTVAFLLGDVNGNLSVNAADIGLTKSQSGVAVDAGNFRADVNVNGAINAADVGQVKAQSGTFVPTSWEAELR
ncbi:hypothetical protein BH20VER2_BH20VER2_10350 [soil metagenome]